MLEEQKLMNLCNALDDLTNLDVFGKNVIQPMYQATVAKQGGAPSSLLGARIINEHVKPRDAVLIATGFPERAWISRIFAETDGPVGAATLARGIELSMDAIPVIMIDEPFVPLMENCCRAAGLVPFDLKYFENYKRESGFQAAFVVGIPIDRKAGEEKIKELIDFINPSVAISIERPGMNSQGKYHQVAGQRIPDDAVADFDFAFNHCKDIGIPTIGIGDGGNEIGMGKIHDEVREIRPEMQTCGEGSDAGTASITNTDILITATVSNFGATALQAALALVTGKKEAMHNVKIEERVLEWCNASDGIDGGETFGTEPAVDDIPIPAYSSITALAEDMVNRALNVK